RGNAAQARELFAEFPLMLDFFESTIGPYPYATEKMGVVETPHLGMEHQTINAYGNEYRKSEYGYDWLLQHEFAHEWFGNQLTNNDWDDMWLHEGFGTYMQPLYMQWLRGDMEYNANLMKQRAALINKFPVVSGKPHTSSEVYDEATGPGHDLYYKGSLVLHTLRGLIGDADFFDATRQVVYGTTKPQPGNFKPRYGTTIEFIRAVNRATGRDYQWFFDSYLYAAALPELLTKRDAGGMTLRWKTAGDRPFPMPVEVRINGRDRTMPMKNGQGSIDLPANAVVTIDPHSKVLREQAHINAYQVDMKARTKAADGKPPVTPNRKN
ncbi:MAG: M1 family peptidase, partial [Pseudomonadota bacterium]|nr:M1 family peptidase [Pseudomonadota bacterium]